MNAPPRDAIRVAPDRLRVCVADIMRAAGMASKDADLLAELLTLNDLRGVFSHGTQRIPEYVRLLREGEINPCPEVRQVAETSTTLIIDGDGGLGYFPAHCAAHAIVGKCREHGMAAVMTRNHGHIGAAGLYPRIAAAEKLICYCTSGHQLNLDPNESIMRAAGGSPMSFAIPAGEEPPLVLDFGTMHDLYGGVERVRPLFEMAPGLVFRGMGLGAVCQALGGLLAGVPADPERAVRRFPAANQGSLLIALEVEPFMPLEDFLSEMDQYIRKARQMKPMPGYAGAYLPGGPEAAWEAEWTTGGVPVGEAHRQVLEGLGEELHVEVAF